MAVGAMGILLRVEEAVEAAVVSEYLKGRTSVQEACERLSLHRSTFFRKVERFKAGGPEALAHALRGRRSNRRHTDKVRDAVLELYAREYAPHGFNTTHFYEEAHARFPQHVSYASVWRWLKAASLVVQRHRPAKHRMRRPRKEAFGQMLQMDTSIHDWLGVGANFALVSAMDDATNRLGGVHMAERDTTLANFAALRQAFGRYGLPGSVYVDRSPVFKVSRTGYGKVLKARFGSAFTTQVQRALDELRVELIHAYTPQAKGRIERSFGTWQGRLVPELRKHGVRELTQANAYIQEVFVPKFNERFALPVRSVPSAWVRITGLDLDYVLAEKHTLRVSNDHIVKSKDARLHLQLLKSRHRVSYARALVDVFRHVDGRTSVRFQGHSVPHLELAA
jgi:transposase